MKIYEIPKEFRPREKALKFGLERLSDQELLALIIGSGVRGHSALEIANELLSTHYNSLESLVYSNLESLKSYRGLNKITSLKLLASFEFHKRLNSYQYKNQDSIKNIGQIYERYKYLETYDYEVLIIVVLDSKRRLKKEKTLYKGTYDSFTINVDEVLKELVLAQARYFILIHNHPDETNKPSQEDIMATKAIERNALNLNIKLLDHIIIYKNGFFSIKNKQNYEIHN